MTLTIDHLFFFCHLHATVIRFRFSGSKHNIFPSDERDDDNNNTMTASRVRWRWIHVALLAAFTAGLKVKDSHRGDASDFGVPFFLCEPRAFLVPSSFHVAEPPMRCPTWCFAAPLQLSPPSTPTEPFWRRECKLWSLPLVNVSWRLPAYHWRRRHHQSLEATEQGGAR